ncbi:hypothetical protein M9H77_36290 [Catharanthus roseus]|uniref:Uncharacterized protein n=1 Tax=Catharanthus roseus TaxID=4058 RepID=A0ACB9ZRR8_CATRO|nr:hypothetical protein M9H77_36290 [Catharanthus roseus]
MLQLFLSKYRLDISKLEPLVAKREKDFYFLLYKRKPRRSSLEIEQQLASHGWTIEIVDLEALIRRSLSPLHSKIDLSTGNIKKALGICHDFEIIRTGRKIRMKKKGLSLSEIIAGKCLSVKDVPVDTRIEAERYAKP